MGQTGSVELGLLLAGVFLLLAVLASKASSKLGIPALVLFIGIGMAAGSEGPGGIAFDNVAIAKLVGTVALAFILFAGGLDSDWKAMRPVLWRGLSLAIVGTAVTALVIGFFAHHWLGFTWIEGMLLGSIVASTDAAAVFAVLRTGGFRLKHRITPTLELESGTNDPLAVFLTLTFINLAIGAGGGSWMLILPTLLLEMAIGLAVGVGAGFLGVWIINHVKLEYDGLYPAVTIAIVCLTFGGANLVHGNSFLAVYIAGLWMGNRNFLHRLALLQFHDGLAWLFQILMFVVLGLLVFPSELQAVAVSGLLLSALLMFVARPLAVLVSLSATRMRNRARLFVAWAGLRGAVPIILSLFPLLAGVEKAPLIFNLVFFVVLTSVVLQGTSLGWIASLLKVAGPLTSSVPDLKPASGELLEVFLKEDSPVIGRQVVELSLPNTALLVLLERSGTTYIPRGATVLRPGDKLLVATRKEDHEELRAKLEGGPIRSPEPAET